MKLIISILLLTIGAFAQTTYKDGSDCNCDSIVKEYYKSGELRFEIPYVNGKKHGIGKRYWKSGKSQGTTTFKNGEFVGWETIPSTTKTYNNKPYICRDGVYCNNKIGMIGKDTAFVAHYYEHGELWFIDMKMVGNVVMPQCAKSAIVDCIENNAMIQYGKNFLVLQFRLRAGTEEEETYEFGVEKQL